VICCSVGRRFGGPGACGVGWDSHDSTSPFKGQQQSALSCSLRRTQGAWTLVLPSSGRATQYIHRRMVVSGGVTGRVCLCGLRLHLCLRSCYDVGNSGCNTLWSCHCSARSSASSDRVCVPGRCQSRSSSAYFLLDATHTRASRPSFGSKPTVHPDRASIRFPLVPHSAFILPPRALSHHHLSATTLHRALGSRINIKRSKRLGRDRMGRRSWSRRRPPT
jgi:hypothetical protein